jgi:hypothetical protein
MRLGLVIGMLRMQMKHVSGVRVFDPAVTPVERRLASLENAPKRNEVGLSYHSQHEKTQESKPNVGCIVKDVRRSS